MPYATATQIQAEFKDTTFSVSSPVTIAELDAWILEFGAVVDSRLSTKYTVPLTDATAVLLAELIVRNFVSARVKRILNADKSSQSGTEETDADKLDKQAWKLLDALAKGDMDLINETASSVVTVASYAVSANITPKFMKEVEQW